MLPFIKYPGGKIRELPIIEKYKPSEIERYFEPFVGGGAVYFKLNCENSYINDKSKDLYCLYNAIQNGNKKLQDLLRIFDTLWKKGRLEATEEYLFNQLHLNYERYKKYFEQSISRKEKRFNELINAGIKIAENDRQQNTCTAQKTAIYMCVRDLYNKMTWDEHQTLAFFVLREYCYSSMFRFDKKGRFNVPYGGRSYNDKSLLSKIETMFSNEMKAYLKKTTISNMDFEDFLTTFSPTEKDFVFLDPPYDSEFSTYDQLHFGENEQCRLHKCLINMKANWMLIIKKTAFIESLYQNFNILEYEKRYSVSFKNRNTKEATHLLITNYTLKEKNGRIERESN